MTDALTPVFVLVNPSHTDADLRDLIAQTREARLKHSQVMVLCRIGGFDHDPRELGSIPEARRFCQRLFDTGFVSYLDTAVLFLPTIDLPAVRSLALGLGAFEVWLIAKGHLLQPGKFSIPADVLGEWMKEFTADVLAANAEADRAVGGESDRN